MYKVLDKTSKSVLLRMDLETFEEMEKEKKISHRRPSSVITNLEFEAFTKEETDSLMLKGKKTYDSICNSLRGI